ncbi:MAG TPA: selenide, water dikinase SelD, partial [Ktedonobacteraceae bacterium]|nr:selenide, water dikinase SelD [Ktedonobacteraceae bacterium]
SLQSHVHIGDHLGEIDQAILFDPQTSGGLFAAIEPSLWPALSEQKDVTFWRVGEVTELVNDRDLIALEVE